MNLVINKTIPLLKLALVACVITVFVLQLDLASVSSALSSELLLGALAMQILLFGATLLNALRHAMLIVSPRAPLGPCLSALLLSAGLNLVTPGRISEIIKATYLRQRLSIPLSNGTATIVIERLFDLCVVSVIGLVGFLGIYFKDARPLIFILSVSVLLLLQLRPIAARMLPWLNTRRGRLFAFIRNNCQHIVTMLTWRLYSLTFLLTVFSWSLHCAAIWLFFAVQPSYGLSLAETTLIFGAIIFAGALPALPGGIGAIQAAVTFALVKMGIPFEKALVLSIALHVAEILICAISAPYILVSQPTGVGDLMGQISGKARK